MTGEARALAAVARLDRPQRRQLALSVALSAGAVATACALLATSGYLISRAAERPPVLLLTAAIVAVRAMAIARAGLRYGERVVSHDLALRLLAGLRQRFYRRLAPLVPGELRGLDRGQLLSRFVGDVEQLQHLYLRGIAPPLVAALTVVGAGAAAAIMAPAAGLALGGTLLVAAVTAPLLTARIAAAGGRAEAAERAALTSRMVEAIDGAAELAVAGRAPERAAGIEGRGARLAGIQRRYAAAGAAATALGGLLSAVALVAVLAIGVDAVRAGSLSRVLLAALAFLALAAFEGIAPLPDAARHLHACAVAAHRLEDTCAAEPAVRDPQRAVPLPPRGVLAVHDVWVRYAPGDPWALRGVSLRVAPGEKLAVMGPSGAGKTTLAHLLVRFRDPDRGRVTYGGVDVREARQSDVRAAVALVDQDAYLFTTSLRENVLLARPGAGDEEILRALEQAGLGAWLAALPDGLDTLVGEDGAMVSGGEGRRIALARGLLSHAPVLVVDEPTAHLDAGAGRRLLSELATGTGDRAVVVITHASAGAEAFDRVVQLVDGAVVEGQVAQAAG